MQTYLFYDIETTGLNKAFDQVVEFAAIRTDLQLNEISRHEWLVKLNCDVIPSPHAIITHHIGVAQSKLGISEYQAMQKIHALMNEPGTISLGYNTLGFDDEFLRFSFYRNLLTPYTHQYANQCARMDLYPMTVLYHLYKNSIMSWPEIEGKISFKLEHLNQVNNFALGNSHRAMIDVEATLALARVLHSERIMWDYLVGYFNKTTDQIRLTELFYELKSHQAKHYEGILVDGSLGHAAARQSWVLYLGEHQVYKNQNLWLRLDVTNFSLVDPAEIINFTWVVRKKWGEPGFVLPTKERFITHFTAEKRHLIETNKTWLQNNPNLLAQIVDYYRTFEYPTVPTVDVEARLYLNRFMTGEETLWCRQFHQASLAEKSSWVDKAHNAQLKDLAIRIIGRHDPHCLSPEQQIQFAAYQASLRSAHEQHDMIDYRGQKKLKPHTALQNIQTLRGTQSLSATQQHLLDELEDYLVSHFDVSKEFA